MSAVKRDILDECLEGGIGLSAPSDPSSSLSDVFFRDFWHQRPLHATGNPHRFDSRFRLADLEFLWTTAAKVDPSSMLFFDSTNGRGQVHVLRSAFFAFCHNISVVVNKADKLSPAILRICEALQQRRFPFVYCNVYSTPAGAQTVPAHSDDRDVFVLQVHGAKHWTVYADPPVHLPYKHEEVGKDKDKRVPGPNARVAFEGVLEAGDVMYLPRGFVHVARALPSSPSVHLTIAVQTSDWDINALVQDGVHAAIDDLLATDAGRQPPPPTATAGAEPSPAVLRTVLPPSVLGTALADPPASPAAGKKNDGAAEADAEAERLYSERLAADFAKETAFVEQLKQAARLVLQRLEESPQRAIQRFRSRMQDRLEARTAFFEEHVAPLRYYPLAPSSLLLWNARVRIAGVGELRDAPKRIGNISVAVAMEKGMAPAPAQQRQQDAAAERVDTMHLHVSPQVMEVMLAWAKNFTRCPAPLSEMAVLLSRQQQQQASQPSGGNAMNGVILQCICIASFLLRNGCLVRVS